MEPCQGASWSRAGAGITTKAPEEVYKKFVENFLLEEGAPQFILTDRGTEFKNEILRNLMEMLKIRLRFTPSYHPRGNYTERVNRFIGESLRTMVSMDGAKQSDWWKLTRAAGAQSYLEDYTSSVFRDGENGGSRVASRAAVRDCESVTELLGGGLHSG